MGLFDKLKQGLSKTWKSMNTDVRDLFKSEGRLVDQAFLDEMRALLFKTDMGYEAVEEIVNQVATNFRARVVTLEQVVATWKEKLRKLMAQDDAPIRFAESGPTVIMVCGVNGTPKSHPASVAYRAVEQAIKTGMDVCIIDTAGRLQTQKNLMAELTKIQESIRKQLPAGPHEVLLVLDATTGQNGVSQAKKFTESVNCTGIVLAKLDGTAKGGVVVAIRQQVGLPVKYVGIGEKAEDLAEFKPDEFVDALFDEITSKDKRDD
jgi:fused signal recognition particle receptor